MKTPKGKSPAKKLKPAPVVAPEPKPQIPTMLRALRRERETARTLIEALEAKLAPVLRPNGGVMGSAAETFSEAAPVAQVLGESVSIFAALNARLRDITGRVEL
jgi:hypothetical protein